MFIFIYKCTFLVLMMKVLHCQESPCPTIFQYKNDNYLYGRIEVPFPDDQNNMVELVVQLSIAKSNCTGKSLHEYIITFLGSATDLILKTPLVFRLDFPPWCNILPKITHVSVNNITFCTATAIQGSQVTTINLYSTITLMSNLTPPQHQLNGMIDKNHVLQSKSNDFHKTNRSPQPTRNFDLYIQHFRSSSSKTSVYISEYETVPEIAATKKYLNDCGSSKFLVDQKIEIQKGTYPWMGALYRRELESPKLLCGASLISTKLALTAGHCVAPHLDAKLYLTFGNTNLLNWFDNDVQIAKVQAVEFHPKFRNDSADADLAILIFAKELSLTPVVQPVCLWNSDDSLEEIDKKTGIVVDWNKNDSFEIMQHLLQDYAVIQSCLQSSIRITSNRALCAEIRNNSEVCNNYGGSGFYLLLNGRWTIRGIVSPYLIKNNETCNLPQRVTLLDVAKYIDWIDTFL